MDGASPSQRARVERAAAALTPIERAVLVLSAGERLSVSAIAARTGIRERGVERILARAVRKLDRALERQQQSSRKAR